MRRRDSLEGFPRTSTSPGQSDRQRVTSATADFTIPARQPCRDPANPKVTRVLLAISDSGDSGMSGSPASLRRRLSMERMVHGPSEREDKRLRDAAESGRKRGASFPSSVASTRSRYAWSHWLRSRRRGELTFLAPLLREAQGAVFAVVAEIPEPEPGDGTDPGTGVGEGAEDRAIADAHGAGAVDGFQEPPGLGGTDLGRLPVQRAPGETSRSSMPRASHRSRKRTRAAAG